MGEGDKAWYQSPWLWGGCGCAAGCVLLPILLVVLVGGGAFFALRSSGVAQEAMERARQDPELAAALGEPIETGWLIQGNISIQNDGGSADFSLPISGPHGKGRLYVVAERRAGEWIFRDLYAVVDGREDPIELTAPPPAEEAGPQSL